MNRLKKILKWTAVVLGGLAAISLVANACFVWITDIRLERQLAALRAAGDPISLADLAPKPIPPEKNAYTYLRQAQPGVAAINEMALDSKSCETWIKRWQNGHVMPIEGLKAVKKALNAHPEVIPLLERAAACPDCDPQLTYTRGSDGFVAGLTPYFQAARPVIRVVQWRANLLISQGKLDEGVQSGLLLFRLVDHYSRNPTVVAYLVALTGWDIGLEVTNLALQNGPVSKQARDALDAELALQESLESYIRMVKGFRAIEADDFHNDPRHNFWLISRGLWNWRESEFLDKIATLLEALHGPRPEIKALGVVHRPLHRKADMETLSQQPFFALEAPCQVIAMYRAKVRCLRVLNAVQRCAPAASDSAPKLTELGLPLATTTDPFTDPYTGEPLHVKKLPEGWLVYSVGWNGKDDGGNFERRLDIGVGPPPPATRTPTAPPSSK
jgi:hypothetical protein